MNLVAKIKRLEMEAAERDKRIAALEAKVAALFAAIGPVKTPVEDAADSATPPADPLHDVCGVGAAIAAKKRKPRAKTYGTE